MLKTVLAGALASGALAAGGAQAHDFNYPYGYDRGVPAYAAGGYAGGGYAPYHPSRFALFGARAGVTVLGVDVDASAKLTVGASGWGHGRGYAPPAYAPPPPVSYEPPPPPPVSYAPPPMYSYGYQGPVSYGYSYGYGACGC